MSAKLTVMMALCAFTGPEIALAQTAPVTIIEIDVENLVCYSGDVTDYAKFATDPNITTRLPSRNFANFRCFSDVVAVNSRPAKGTETIWGEGINLTPSPNSGQAIADITRSRFYQQIFEILQADGTPVGTIMNMGYTDGPPPPGGIPGTTYNSAIVGGTGAFLGARGQIGTTTVTFRQASRTEDPGFRRINGGGKEHYLVHLVPMSRPDVVGTPNGPAVVHANDFSLVTPNKPARSGEVLSLIATGLGPTRPGVDLGQPFPTNPSQVVNAPVAVTVNGAAADVMYAGGYPATTNTYQVNFRLPAGVAPGMAAIQISSAWIAGPEVRIAVE